MKINIFTIRNKQTDEIIYAEGIDHAEFYSNFELDKQYFTEEEWGKLNNMGAWYISREQAHFDEEIRHLNNYSFEKIIFNTQEEYEFVSQTELKRIK